MKTIGGWRELTAKPLFSLLIQTGKGHNEMIFKGSPVSRTLSTGRNERNDEEWES